MGIRYYAYAFDADLPAKPADPVIAMYDEALADAWGLSRDTRAAIALLQKLPPQSDMVDLDKAWRELQRLTVRGGEDGGPRAAYRMFEGRVYETGQGYLPWYRIVSPDEVPKIAEDLGELQASVGPDRISDRDPDYILFHLRQAAEFTAAVAAAGRGFVYHIG